uniref:VP1 n=8 Tax=Porcine bocavirus 1 TaxID=1048219 RepID=A0A513PZC7_9VIRU|nr:MAG: VP1 [Porcine bocavirus 1]
MNQLFPVVRSKKNDGKRGHGKKAEKRPSELKDPEKPTGELELVGERSNCSKTQRHFYFARQNQGAKRAKMSAQGGENIEEVEVDTGAGSGRSGGGGGGGGGGGSTNGGIGMATGGWVGGTYFGKNKIVTNITRQWYVPIYNGHKYTKQTETDNTNFWNGIRTPWGYINMNSYSCHFSPNDWQRLLNNYKRWKPKKMRLQLYNLQIKQVVQLDTSVQYYKCPAIQVSSVYNVSQRYKCPAIQVSSDTSVQLIQVIYNLPNYCLIYNLARSILTSVSFIKVQYFANIGNIPIPLASLYEVPTIQVSTGFEFDFDCGWVHNDRAFCPPQCDFNPLIKTRRSRIIMGSSGNTSEPYYDYKKPSNWMPGPGTRLNGHQSGSNLKTSSGPFNTSWAPPGVTQGSDTTYLNSPAMNQSQWASKSMPTAPANAACSQVDPNSLAFNEPTQLGQQGDTNIRYNNISNDLTRWGTVWSQSQQVYTSQPTQTRLDTVWQYPMQAWNGQEVTRYAPIWDKQPNTDYHTTLSSSDGTLPMKHPPGNIFIKVAKIPIPTETNTDSYLNIYCTGQISIEIEWDAEEYETKNWRPELRITSSNIGRGVYNINAAGEYNTTGSQLSNMPTRFGMNRIN